MDGLDDTVKEPAASRDETAPSPERPPSAAPTVPDAPATASDDARQLELAFVDTVKDVSTTEASTRERLSADVDAPDAPAPPSRDPGDTLFVKVKPKAPPPALEDEPREALEPRRPRIPKLAVAAVALALCIVGAGVAVARSGADASHVEAGVTVGGVALSGRDEPAVAAALEELETKLAHLSIPLVLGSKEVRFEPSQAGFAIDDAPTIRSVLEAGRAHSFFGHVRALGRGRVDVPLTVTIDESLVGDLIDDWETRLVDDRPSLGGVHFEGMVPKADLPRAGHRIDRPALIAAIRATLARGDAGRIEVPVEVVTPTMAASDVEDALAQVTTLTAGDIVLAHAPSSEDLADATLAEEQRRKRADEDKALAPKRKPKKRRRGPRNDDAPLAPPTLPPIATPRALELVFSQAELVATVRAAPKPDGTGLSVSLDEEEIHRKIAAVSGKLADSARDARFEVDEKDQVTIVPSRPGTRVDAKKVADAIVAAAHAEGRRGELPVDHGVEPALTTQAAEALHIKGLVSEFTTHHPCCQPRVINIHRIADIMNDALVKPGDTMSVNKYVGPRTSSRGFVLAPSIGDGEMVDTVGGGISQFATTLFNSLFDGGYAIRERRAHSFYFSRYPMGIEATLSDPSPDLIFINDTDAGLLIKAHYDNTSITVKLYGDNGGRKVERHVSGAFDFTDPKSEYEADDRLEPDEEKVKEKGQSGWSVWASRIITMPNGDKREEKRKITYKPRPRLVRTHSCNIPKGEPDYTGRPCPKKKESDEGTTGSGTPEAGSTGPGDPALSP